MSELTKFIYHNISAELWKLCWNALTKLFHCLFIVNFGSRAVGFYDIVVHCFDERADIENEFEPGEEENS